MSGDGEEDYNPFAAPRSDLTPETLSEITGAFVYAGFWARFVAEVIDIVIVRFVDTFAEIVLKMVAFAGSSYVTGVDLPLLSQIIKVGFSFVFFWLYYTLQECSNAQATLGKRVMGLRVQDLPSNRVTFGRATGRYFGKLISAVLLFIGYLIQPFTSRRQTLHDIMAGTIVVKG